LSSIPPLPGAARIAASSCCRRGSAATAAVDGSDAGAYNQGRAHVGPPPRSQDNFTSRYHDFFTLGRVVQTEGSDARPEGAKRGGQCGGQYPPGRTSGLSVAPLDGDIAERTPGSGNPSCGVRCFRWRDSESLRRRGGGTVQAFEGRNATVLPRPTWPRRVAVIGVTTRPTLSIRGRYGRCGGATAHLYV